MSLDSIGNPFEAISNRLDQIENSIAEMNSKLGAQVDNNVIKKRGTENEVGGIELAMEVTRLKRGTIYNYVNKRAIPNNKVGGKIEFERAKLEKWNLERTVKRSLSSNE